MLTERVILIKSLSGLVKPVRCVKFSPVGKLLAACGDSTVVALFDVISGEQVANLAGHSSWVFAVAWNSTGDHLISGYETIEARPTLRSQTDS